MPYGGLHWRDRTQIGWSFQGTSPRRFEQQRGPFCPTAFQQRKSLPRGHAGGRGESRSSSEESPTAQRNALHSQLSHARSCRNQSWFCFPSELISPLVHAHLGAREQFYLHTMANNELNCASFLTPWWRQKCWNVAVIIWQSTAPLTNFCPFS